MRYFMLSVLLIYSVLVQAQQGNPSTVDEFGQPQIQKAILPPSNANHPTSQNDIGTVSEVSASDAQIIIEYQVAPRSIRKGDYLSVVNEDGRTCSFVASDITESTVIANSEFCPDIENIRVGQEVRKSKFKRTARGHKPKYEKKGIAIFLSYSFADAANSAGNLSILNSNVGYTETDTSTGAFGINAEYFMLREQQIGFSGGLTYEFARTVNSYNANAAGVTLSGNYPDPKPKYAFVLPYANSNYMFSKYLYAFGGLNYSIISASNVSGASYSGKIGYQLGVGSMLDEHWGAELEYRWINFGGSGPQLSIDNVSLNGLLLKAGYHFNLF